MVRKFVKGPTDIRRKGCVVWSPNLPQGDKKPILLPSGPNWWYASNKVMGCSNLFADYSPVLTTPSDDGLPPDSDLDAILTRIILDIFHGMKRIQVSPLHPAAQLFAQRLRDAIFAFIDEDKVKVEAILAKSNTTFHEKLRSDPKYILDRVRRRTYPPAEMAANVEVVREEFSKESYCDSNGKPLLSRDNLEEIDALLKHIRKGCLMDPPDVSLYRKVKQDKDGLTIYTCSRGTK